MRGGQLFKWDEPDNDKCPRRVSDNWTLSTVRQLSETSDFTSEEAQNKGLEDVTYFYLPLKGGGVTVGEPSGICPSSV